MKGLTTVSLQHEEFKTRHKRLPTELVPLDARSLHRSALQLASTAAQTCDRSAHRAREL